MCVGSDSSSHLVRGRLEFTLRTPSVSSSAALPPQSCFFCFFFFSSFTGLKDLSVHGHD